MAFSAPNAPPLTAKTAIFLCDDAECKVQVMLLSPLHVAYRLLREEGVTVPGVQSPPLRRRRLGQELRQLRDAAGLTIEEVAQRLEVSPAKISRIETGQVGVHPRDVSGLLDQYKIYGAHRDNLLKLTREARQQVWWHSYSDVLPPGLDVWIRLETEAEAIRTFEVQLVPGLLQTSDYARTVLRAYYPSESSEQIERRVKLRIARQELVIEQNDTPIWAVLDESVLRRHIIPEDLMQSQYRRLLELSEKNNIRIQILPFDAGVYTIPGGFTMMQLPYDPDVVVIEYRGGTLLIEQPEEVVFHAQVFDLLRVNAKGAEESLSDISHLAKIKAE
jgi:transcriptional regulator with XRE-family HTH domain